MDRDSKKTVGFFPAPAEEVPVNATLAPDFRFHPTDEELKKGDGDFPANATMTSLAPGFRFHPSDEELVNYYLKRKVLSKPVCFEAIAECNIYDYEPWNLAEHSKLKTRDQEWYFFVNIDDKKSANGVRLCRKAKDGYWSANGKDCEIHRIRDMQLIGGVDVKCRINKTQQEIKQSQSKNLFDLNHHPLTRRMMSQPLERESAAKGICLPTVPASHYTKLMISNMQKEYYRVAVEKDKFKLELMSAKTSISSLQTRINELCEEIEELRSKATRDNALKK